MTKKTITEERVLSSELSKKIGEKVTIKGWLHKAREMGALTFLVLRDRHGLIQIVVDSENERQKLHGLQVGSVLTVNGKVVEEKRTEIGAELHEPEIFVDVPVSFPSPIEIDKPIDHTPENLETLFENKVVNMRNITEQGIFRVQASVKDLARKFLISQDFTEFNSPKLLAGSTEGGAEVFKLDYFGKEATLAQSAQFYKQIMVGVFERAFEINPTYRAEMSVTTRHMTEFIHIDAEMGFITGTQDLMKLLSGFVNFVSENIWQLREKELKALKATPVVLKKELPEISMKDLHELVFKETGEDFRKEKDPSPIEERFICDYSAKEWGSEAVFITDFPASEMKFYHKRSDKNPEVAERFDLIFRGVEIVTGSMRENRYEKLIEQMKAQKLDPEHPGFKYYLQAFKYGMPMHGGFGMGLERLTQKIIGLKNVKEATLFPRDTGRLAP